MLSRRGTRRLILFLLPILAGCVAASLDWYWTRHPPRQSRFAVDPAALDYPPFDPIINGKHVTIEVISVNGAKPPEKGLKDAVAAFSRYVAGEVEVLQDEPVTVDLNTSGVLTTRQLDDLLAKTKSSGPSSIIIVIAQEHDRTKDAGAGDFLAITNAATLRDDKRICNLIRIRGQRMGEWVAKCNVDADFGWHDVLLHEFGHCLEVPLNRSHCWDHHHCTNAECVMCDIGRIRGPGEADFCAECQQDLREARASVGGKLIEPAQSCDAVLEWDSELIRLNPDQAVPYFGRGRDHQSLGFLDLAIADYTKAIELYPGDARFYNSRGNCRADLKDYALAIQDYSKTIELDPENIQRYINRGFAYYLLKDYPNVILDYKRAIESGPQGPAVYTGLAVAYMNTGKPQEGIEAFSRAIEVDKKNPIRYRNRGNARYRIGEVADAISDYEMSIRLGEPYHQGMNELAWIYATCPDGAYRNGKRAVELATRACELTQWREPFYVVTLAAACAECGDFKNAIDYQSEALALGLGDGQSKCEEMLKDFQAGKAYREPPGSD